MTNVREEECLYCPACMLPFDECSCWETSVPIYRPAHCLKLWTSLRQGRYLIGQVLGQGGFGISYVARETMLYDSPVVVKEYFPSVIASRDVSSSNGNNVVCAGDPKQFKLGKERFLSEAQTLIKLKNVPGIVNALDYIEENNTAYYVMDLLIGQDLSVIVESNPMDPVVAFRKMLPIAKALDLVNARGVIHRDVSPDNIKMLEDGSLRVMDFGAARQTNMFDGRAITSMVKPGYSAPEQYAADGLQGAWTDIYGYCATIYACVTGRGPIDSLRRQVFDSIEWPSDLGVSISSDLEAILKKGMSLDYRQRYRSFSELVQDVEEALDSEPKSVVVEMATGFGGDFSQKEADREKDPLSKSKQMQRLAIALSQVVDQKGNLSKKEGSAFRHLDDFAGSVHENPLTASSAFDEAYKKSLYDVVLNEAYDNKIAVMKVIKEARGISLREAWDLAKRTPPTVVGRCLPLSQAEKLCIELKKEGAAVSVRRVKRFDM